MADLNGDLQRVLVPDIGDFDDVPVIELLVEEGATVTPEQPLVVLESDKATMEVPSPSAGTVEKLAVAVGDSVSEGDLILELRVSVSDDSPANDGESEEQEPEAPAGGGGGESDDESAPDDPESEDSDRPATSVDEGEEPHAGPAARRLARELAVDLSAVSGSGRNGRITSDDVRAAAEGAGSPGDTASTAPALAGLPPWPTVDHSAFGPTETVPLSRIKRIGGPILARNWVVIPHVTQHDEADITALEAFRKEINADHAPAGVKVTMVSLLLKALAATLRAFPEFNASLDGDQLVLKHYHHLGFAVDTPGGLLVPVIRDVDRKGLLEIARELIELSGAAREGALSAEAMRGGTFTLSSLGGIGGSFFTPIINAPEVAILGAGRAVMRPHWDGEAFQPRLMLPLSLSYDHRVIDGAAAARFIAHLGGILADPRRMLL